MTTEKEYKNGHQRGQKSGPWTKEERQFIRLHYRDMDARQLANCLKRNYDSMCKYLTKEGLWDGKEIIEEEKYLDIRNTRHWQIFVNQFSKAELEVCIYHWNSILEQFQENINHTEEIQIIDLIKCVVLSDRLLTAEQQQQNTIAELEKHIRSERSKKAAERNQEYILNMEKQIANLYAAMETISREYRDLVKQKIAMLDKLKATRDHRITQLENKNESLVTWFRELSERPELRRKLGLEMEKMRIAVKEEYMRLSDFYQYADGMIDQPILCAETLKDDNEE